VLEAVVAKNEHTVKESKRTVAVIEAETKPRVVSEVAITGISVDEFQAVDAKTGLSKEDEFRLQIAKDLGIDASDVIISKVTVTAASRRRLGAAEIKVAFIIMRKAAEKAEEIRKKVAELKLAVKGASVSKTTSKVEAAKAKSAVEAALKKALAAAAKAKATLADAKEKYDVAKKEALLLTPGEEKVLPSGLVYLARSGKNQLVRITKRVVTPTERTTLAGRSYGTRSWESASSSRATELLFSCGTASDGMVFATAAADYTAGDVVCSTTIPAITDGRFHIEVYDNSKDTVVAGDLASRFLQTATFGSSKDDISTFQTTFGGKPEAWIAAQMKLPASSHRAFFRKRANRRMPTALRDEDQEEIDHHNRHQTTEGTGHIHAAASPLAACTTGSRWHKFAFTRADVDKAFVAKSITKAKYSSDATVFTAKGAGGDCCETGKFESLLLGRSAPIAKDWRFGTITSEKGCEAECAANAECKYFTYQPTRKLCVYCSGCDYQQYDAARCRRVKYAGTGYCDNTARGYDSNDYMQFTTWKKEAGSAVAQEKVSLTVENHLRTTFVDDAGYLKNVPKPYRICSVDEKIGGIVKFGADCSGMFPNPAIALDTFPKDSLVVKTTHLKDTLHGGEEKHGVRLPGVKILGAGDSTFTCETAPMHGPQFAISETDGSIYMFDRRVRSAENTLAHPDAKRPAADRYECPNVPKSFLNAHTCRTGAESCSPIGYSSKMFTLDDAIIKQFYTLASRHVHVVTGLTTENSPCTTGTSRWVARKASWDKCDDRLDADSRAVITEAITFKNLCAKCDKYRLNKRRDGPDFDIITRASSRDNAFVRDVMIHKQCKAEAGAQVLVDGVCWQHVHEDEMNVYDFTYWADAHDDPKAAAALKEGSKAVAAFAETGSAEFKWTGSMPLWYATTRDRRMKIGLLGPFGNNVDFVAIPLDSRVEQIARVVGSEKSGGDASTEVCGSPGEVANDPLLGDTVNMHLASGQQGFRQTRNEYFDSKVAQRDEAQMILQNVFLSAQDQLRQRVAWALNEIFVVNNGPIYRKKSGNAHFLNYFDIFVRNAFGNYRDILKEVSYSPMMGYMLTFMNSRSRKVTGNAPDENYAREVCITKNKKQYNTLLFPEFYIYIKLVSSILFIFISRLNISVVFVFR
jgi:hypothetical protein